MIEVNIDGGARGNPGPAAIGVVARTAGRQLFALGRPIGKATNNVAEYTALICALKKLAQTAREENIKLLMDSELVVKQVKGEYRVKDADLKILHERALALLKLFEAVDIAYVPRAKNFLADRLVNKVLDTKV